MIKERTYSKEQQSYLNAKFYHDAVALKCNAAYDAEIPGYSEGLEHVDDLSAEEVTHMCALMDVIDKRFHLREAIEVLNTAKKELIEWGAMQAETAPAHLYSRSRAMVRRLFANADDSLTVAQYDQLVQIIMDLVV